MKVTAIITGGGVGKRFGGKLPKQFRLIGRGKERIPMIIRAILPFNSHPDVDDLIVAIPSDYVNRVKSMVKRYKLTKVKSIIAGGRLRSISVKNSLIEAFKSAKKPDRILIHDAVRPMVDKELISRVIKGLDRYKAVVPVMKPNDTVRLKKGNVLGKLINRESVLLIQTPQGFRGEVIDNYITEWKNSPKATDDATVIIRKGISVGYVDGSPFNIKITRPEDMSLAKSIVDIM